jgi:hypothetical protein
LHIITQENLLLLFGTSILFFTLSLGLYRNPILIAITNGKVPISPYEMIKLPFVLLIQSIRHGRNRAILILSLFVTISILMGLFLLRFNFPIIYAVLGFFPLTIVIFTCLYSFIWLVSILLTRIIDVGNSKFNVIFVLITMELLILTLEIVTNPDGWMDTSTFVVGCFNLFCCYVMTCSAMRTVLVETTLHQATFTLRNLWKVALTLMLEFFSELTYAAYLGACYYPDAFNKPVNLFDVFYYIIITFGTVGYGDVYPTCNFTKIIAISTTFTSIVCIGIMFSSFLSASTNMEIQKRKKAVKPRPTRK